MTHFGGRFVNFLYSRSSSSFSGVVWFLGNRSVLRGNRQTVLVMMSP